jgi:hypothetical protein
MSLAVSLRSELLKTKRSATWILTLIMASFAPILILLIFDYDVENNRQVQQVMADPWNFYFRQATAIISIVFLPMYVVLMSTLLPQIEYRNHTWKQVLSSPQSVGRLYFSKFIVFQCLILAYLLAHTLLMGLACLLSNVINPEFKFFKHEFDLATYGTVLFQTYVSILALSALQFCLGMRFKSFLLPIGIGVLFSILGMINMIGFQVVDVDKYFFNYSAFLTFKENAPRIPYVMWMSAGYTVGILVVGFWEFSKRRDR